MAVGGRVPCLNSVSAGFVMVAILAGMNVVMMVVMWDNIMAKVG